MIAPFQLGLDVAVPYGEPAEAGGRRRRAAGRCGSRRPARSGRGSAEAVAGHGLEGDRYFSGAGNVLGDGRGYELTLIEAEALEALAAEGVEISWEEARRNVVTRGIGLNALVGRRFLIGEVECVGRRLAEPCSHLQRLAPPGILARARASGRVAGGHSRERHGSGWRSCGADSGR